MRCVLQRVSRARVTVDGEVSGEVEGGFVVLVGVTHDDSEREAAALARKVAGLRVFEDSDGRMNLSLQEAGGGVLAISQFTLYADVRKGRRPSFTDAARPDRAQPLYERFCELLRGEGLLVQQGVFGAHMQVELVNDGPVTLIIDTADLA